MESENGSRGGAAVWVCVLAAVAVAERLKPEAGLKRPRLGLDDRGETPRAGAQTVPAHVARAQAHITACGGSHPRGDGAA